jgi:hypothetical protein
VLRSIADAVSRRRGYNEAQKTRVENAGILTASGLIAGEALIGLVWSALQFKPEWILNFHRESYAIGFLVLLGLGALMILLPPRNAGDPNEPAPPQAMM